MTILFAGGEIEDFVKGGTGAVSITTSASRFRSTYARCAVSVDNGNAWMSASFTASSSFGVTYRYIQDSALSSTGWCMTLRDGSTGRLRLRPTTSVTSGPTTLTLEKSADGTNFTTLGTTSSTVVINTLYRFDMIVDYQASGRFQLYIGGSLALDVSADLTAGGSTSLSALVLGSPHSGSGSNYSEVIVTDGEDPRPLALKTLVPDSAGDTAQWTGAYTDVDETTASETDILTSDTAAQVTNFNCTGMPAGASASIVPRAVKVVASALRGASGPTKMQLGVKSGSTEGWSSDIALDTGYGPVSNTWTTNPATSAAFTASELDALKLAVKSVA